MTVGANALYGELIARGTDGEIALGMVCRAIRDGWCRDELIPEVDGAAVGWGRARRLGGTLKSGGIVRWRIR